MSELSEKVKSLRAAAGLTQFDAAVISGVDLSVIRTIEQGVSEPLYSNATRLIDALEKAVAEKSAETSAA